MAYGMIVVLPVLPGRLQQVLDIFAAVMPAVRAEQGCLAFSILASPSEPDTLWLYESYVDQRYHDEVHEPSPEVRNVLAQLPQHLSGPWTVHQGELAFTL